MMRSPVLLTEGCGRRAGGAPGGVGARRAAAAALTARDQDQQAFYSSLRRCTEKPRSVQMLHIDKYQEFLRMFILYCSK